MARSVSLDDFGRLAGDLVQAVAADEETVVVTRDEQPVAVLASHKSVLSMASLVDLPRWEEWLRDMKLALPDAAGKLERLGGPAKPPGPVGKAPWGLVPTGRG